MTTIIVRPGDTISIVGAATVPPIPPTPTPSGFVLGVNAHLGWSDGGYSNIPQTIKALQYLGVKFIRDSCSDAAIIPVWQQVASATGAKFIDYLPSGSPALCQQALALVPQLAAAKIISHISGCNEPDGSYATSQGMTLDWAKSFQPHVWTAGQAARVLVNNLSVGANWFPPLYQGNYPNIGDQSAYCNFGNAHTYPQNGDPPESDIARFTDLAKMGAPQRSVIHTEFGYPIGTGGASITPELAGEYVTRAVAASKKAGNAGLIYYGLYDDRSGPWGLFNNDGSPRPGATAFRNAVLAG
jgi:hypothetical protein